MFKFTNLVMFLAPIGVSRAIAYTVGHMGLGVLLPLAKLLATMYVALVVFMVLVLLPIALLVRVPLGRFLEGVSEPVTIAFATASSEAALPRAMEQMERFGVDRETVAFVLPATAST
jgi:Na+/H+-dicarboxylate symporter